MKHPAVTLLVASLVSFAPVRAFAGADVSLYDSLPRKLRGHNEKPYGREGDPRKVKRVIAIEMSDAMRFFPSELSVKRGDTVRFELRNAGQVPHELVIGTMEELKKRAAHKKRSDTTNGAPDGPQLAPGATSRLVWHFPKAGEFYYACLMPGHFDAGMIGTIVVR